MEHILQPHPSKICGHCCVAMVTGRTIQDIVETIGHVNGTKAHELIAALRIHGKNCSERMVFRNIKYLSEVCILTYKWKKGAHAVVYNDGTIYDPSVHYPYRFEEYLHREKGGRITHHINVW